MVATPSTDDSHGSDLPPGEIVLQSRRNICVVIAALVAAIAVVAAASPNVVLDIWGCLACLYVVVLFCFQNSFLEWPEVDGSVVLIVSSSLVAFVAPTLLQAASLWNCIFRCFMFLYDVVVIISAYTYMVRPLPVHIPSGSLRGKTFVITGCNTGIGFETARALAAGGGKVVFACRSEAKAKAAIQRLLSLEQGAVVENQLIFLPLDVSVLASVRTFVEKLREADISVDVLILNAGVMLSSRGFSKDGIEMTMASNHIGHFMLVQLLLPQLLEAEAKIKSSAPPRIVVVGSNMCYLQSRLDFNEFVIAKSDGEKKAFLNRPYGLFRNYGQSKMANILFTAELARRLRAHGSKIPVNALHPGEVNSEVMRDMHPVIVKLNNMLSLFMYALLKNCKQGAACTLHVATSPSLFSSSSGFSGAHFVRSAPAPLPGVLRDEAAAMRLWELSERLAGVKSPI